MSSTKKIIESIILDDFNSANESLSESFVEILKDKLSEAKKIVAAKYGVAELAEALESIDEENLDEGTRIRIVKARLRRKNGKIVVQRRKKVLGSGLKGKGYKMGPDGRPVRMSAGERLRRRRARLKAERKRKSILARIRRNRKMTMRKRTGMGL